MKRWLLVGMLLMGSVGVMAQNNSGRPGNPVAPKYDPVDQRWLIKFSTTVPANTPTLIIGTMTANNFTLAPGIVYSTGSATFGLVSSTGSQVASTFGGRQYLKLQVNNVGPTQTVAVDYTLFDLGVSSSTLLIDKQSWSPDEPVTWQGPLYMRSTGTFNVSGYIIMHQPRMP